MIRRATVEDIPRIVALGAEFHAGPHHCGLYDFDPDSFARTVERVIENGAVFFTEGGAIGLVRAPCIFNHAQTVTSELFFYANDGRGDDLLRAAEQWAEGLFVTGAHEPADPRIQHWYARKGFKPYGRYFAKVI